MKRNEIDFDALNKSDLMVVNRPWTPEEQKEFSAFLLKRKQQRLAREKRAAEKKSQPIHNVVATTTIPRRTRKLKKAA